MSTYSFRDFSSLAGDNILLRPLTTADERAIYTLRSDDRVNEFLDRPKMLHLEEAGTFIQKINNYIENDESLYWVIVLKDNPAVLAGTICLWNFSPDKTIAELGYELLPEYQHRGIMREAIKTVIQFAFNDLHLEAIEAYTHPQNNNSSRLLEKSGFRPKIKDRTNDEPGNELLYTLTPGD